jgi:hypothetical protein
MQELDWGSLFYKRIWGHKIKGANSCKFKNIINKTKKISYTIYLNILLIFGIAS